MPAAAPPAVGRPDRNIRCDADENSGPDRTSAGILIYLGMTCSKNNHFKHTRKKWSGFQNVFLYQYWTVVLLSFSPVSVHKVVTMPASCCDMPASWSIC